MAHLSPFQAVCPQFSRINDIHSFFKEVKQDFQGLFSKGYYKQDEKPSYFLHRVQTKFRSYTGFVGFIHIEDYINGKIKRHEHTIKAKEEAAQGLYEARKGLIKPVLLTYPNVLAIDALTNRLTFSLKPAYEFRYDEEYHTFWRINEPEYIDRMTELFRDQVESTYIADGHHRMQTSTWYYETQKAQNPNHTGEEPYNFVLCSLFPASSIEIHNYNRIIDTLNDYTAAEFLEKLSEVYNIEDSIKPFKPAVQHQMGMYLYGHWYKLTVKPSYLQARKSVRDRLDVQIFNEVVLEGILGVEDVRTYPHISYKEGPKGTSALSDEVDKKDAVAAFNLYPVALEDMVAIADEDGVLPPKSTWFYPRLRSGFIAQLF